ncbi:MAG: hypothetical protein Q9171_005107 [Xanthocarpia ochracea]
MDAGTAQPHPSSAAPADELVAPARFQNFIASSSWSTGNYPFADPFRAVFYNAISDAGEFLFSTQAWLATSSAASNPELEAITMQTRHLNIEYTLSSSLSIILAPGTSRIAIKDILEKHKPRILQNSHQFQFHGSNRAALAAA